MTTTEILAELQAYGTESIKKVFRNHGAKEPFYGVKVEDLKKIQKKVLRACLSVIRYGQFRRNVSRRSDCR